jgi:hypothetical protein
MSSPARSRCCQASHAERVLRRGACAGPHVEADFGDDGASAERADPGHRGQKLDGGAKGAEAGLDLGIEGGDGLGKCIDLAQMEREQEAVVPDDATLQGLGKRLGRCLQARRSAG